MSTRTKVILLALGAVALVAVAAVVSSGALGSDANPNDVRDDLNALLPVVPITDADVAPGSTLRLGTQQVDGEAKLVVKPGGFRPRRLVVALNDGKVDPLVWRVTGAPEKEGFEGKLPKEESEETRKYNLPIEPRTHLTLFVPRAGGTLVLSGSAAQIELGGTEP